MHGSGANQFTCTCRCYWTPQVNINLRLKFQHPSTQLSVNGRKLKWISLLRWKMWPAGIRFSDFFVGDKCGGWIIAEWIRMDVAINMAPSGKSDGRCTLEKFHSGTIPPQRSQPKVIQIKFTRSSSTSGHLVPSTSWLNYEFLLHFVIQTAVAYLNLSKEPYTIELTYLTLSQTKKSFQSKEIPPKRQSRIIRENLFRLPALRGWGSIKRLTTRCTQHHYRPAGGTTYAAFAFILSLSDGWTSKLMLRTILMIWPKYRSISNGWMCDWPHQVLAPLWFFSALLFGRVRRLASTRCT